MSSTERISPTAYATGYLWHRHGLSHPGLVPPEGKGVDRAFRLIIAGTKLFSGVSLDALMLARHVGIDAVLAEAVEAGRVTQVVEIAAGLSPRGWRFMQRYGDRLTYVETDLPRMAETKRALLKKAGLTRPRHEVLELDALAETGGRSIGAVARMLNQNAGTAFITEGLMSYLDTAAAQGVWRRIATALGAFPQGLYLSDLYLQAENTGAAMKNFRRILQAYVRGRMHIHFQSADEAVAAMKQAGFRTATLHATRDLPATQEFAKRRGGERVRILEART